MFRYIGLLVQWFIEFFRGNPRRSLRGGRTGPFYVIGHRGSPCFEVENTIPSFHRAITEDGANGLEFDLCLTKDGVVVVWHDWDPKDPICTVRAQGLEPEVKYGPCLPKEDCHHKKVSELTSDEFLTHYGYALKGSKGRLVDAKIPTFEELLQWITTQPSIRILFFDTKIPEDEVALVPKYMDTVNALLERHPPGCEYVFETMYENVLNAMKAHSPQHNYALDVSAIPGIILDPAKFSAVKKAHVMGNSVATPQKPRHSTIAPWMTYRRVMKHDLELHRAQADTSLKKVISFTINKQEEMQTLIRMGVDGMQTDRPDLLRRVAVGSRLDLAATPEVTAATPHTERGG